MKLNRFFKPAMLTSVAIILLAVVLSLVLGLTMVWLGRKIV